MINQTEQTFYRLDNLNAEQRRISYQMSTRKELDNGSDNSELYARELYVEDKMRIYDGLKNQISKTTAQNNISDSSVSEMKKLLEKVKTELIKANTDTTTDEGKLAVAVSIAGIKENLYDLSNTQIEGEYLFSGSDSSIPAFSKDNATGKITYEGDNSLRKVAVEEGSYRDKGINGFDVLMYPTDVANKNEALTFSEDSRIVDQDGNEWKANAPTYSVLTKYDLSGNATTDTLPITNLGTTPATYSITTPNVDGTKFEAKTSIFTALDNVINALNKVDSLGNPITEAESKAGIASGVDEIGKAYDAVNIAHADLGGKNKIFEISLERVSSKYTQLNILFEEISSVDLAKVASESKALELTYTALYSTIQRTNELSLANFLR